MAVLVRASRKYAKGARPQSNLEPACLADMCTSRWKPRWEIALCYRRLRKLSSSQYCLPLDWRFVKETAAFVLSLYFPTMIKL